MGDEKSWRVVCKNVSKMKNKDLPLLVADDLSPEQEQAARSAALLLCADKFALKLSVGIKLTCVKNLLYYPDGPSPYKPLVDAYLKEQRTLVAATAKTLRAKAQGAFLNGDPTSVLITMAGHRNKYEMVVLGTSGKKGGKRLFLGSVAEEVIRNAKIPVMTVGPKAQRSAAQFLEQEIPTLIIATNLTGNSVPAEAYGLELAQRLGARVVFFHSMRETLPALLQVALAKPYSVSAIKEYTEQHKIPLLKKLELKTKKALKSGLKADYHLDDDTVTASDSILNEITRTKASLVVMGTHGHSFAAQFFFGRSLRDVILSAPVPIISVHSKRH